MHASASTTLKWERGASPPPKVLPCRPPQLRAASVSSAAPSRRPWLDAGMPIPLQQPLTGNEMAKAALTDPFASLTGLPKSSPGATGGVGWGTVGGL